jgi:hypothetical protein
VTLQPHHRQAARLRAEASREAGDIRFTTAVRNIPSEEHFEEVLDWAGLSKWPLGL